MSQENVELVRSSFDHFNRTGYPPDPEFDPDLELTNIRESPLPGLPALLKTSGSKGYHVVMPLDRRADFNEVRELARGIARLAAERDPDELASCRGDLWNRMRRRARGIAPARRRLDELVAEAGGP